MKQHRTSTLTCAFSIEARVSHDGAEICLRGDADASIQHHLHEQFEAVIRTAARELCLQLSELDFCDCAVAGELVAFAEEARTHGKRVTVTAATPWTWTILALVDVGGSLNLTADALKVPPSTGPVPVLGTVTEMLSIQGETEDVRP